MKIALLGNPNTGKSSVFNLLTGLRQQVGNFPGVTIDKRSGFIQLDQVQYELIDFPGTYSIYPRSKEETVVDLDLPPEKLKEDELRPPDKEENGNFEMFWQVIRKQEELPYQSSNNETVSEVLDLA